MANYGENLFESNTITRLSIRKYFTRPVPIIPIEVNRASVALIAAIHTNWKITVAVKRSCGLLQFESRFRVTSERRIKN